MSILNHGSQYLPSDQQSHMYIEYHEGFKKVCERIRAKYPDLTLQACASGGGRANYGVMPYFDEFWVSDNTDALQRIYMQWGTSYFFPAIAMASHISADPQPSNIPGHSPKISDRRSDERPFGHGDPTQKYDRRRENTLPQGDRRL